MRLDLLPSAKLAQAFHSDLLHVILIVLGQGPLHALACLVGPRCESPNHAVVKVVVI